MIKKICKLFYIMDMFYLIINLKKNFLSQKVGPGGGLHIYLKTLVHPFSSPTARSSWSRNKKKTSQP